jgi:hypothetical protein
MVDSIYLRFDMNKLGLDNEEGLCEDACELEFEHFDMYNRLNKESFTRSLH